MTQSCASMSSNQSHSHASSASSASSAGSSWQEQLQNHCKAARLRDPVWNIVSDRRGGRTAWSCTVLVEGHYIPARYWYDGQYVHNAKEDAAEVALQRLRGAQVMRQQQQQMPGLGGQGSPGQSGSYGQHGSGGQQSGYGGGMVSPGGGQGRGGWGLYGSR
ncbi:hypothetical protein EV356DRAFT_111117 [Viridothelium virens]|uniref:DRBM domain-containing protein n=1 Tax=Viridothelium virens TaxID=1048519 RepID=A0A6A6HCG6_VIRVR|nr:hypothetical protein EV356DRAFT_111117 [Viridothelium virens]